MRISNSKSKTIFVLVFSVLLERARVSGKRSNVLRARELQTTKSPSPSRSPSYLPSIAPSKSPSYYPSMAPSNGPSVSPSFLPTTQPSQDPSETPSIVPSLNPSKYPSIPPSEQPSLSPSDKPSYEPTTEPSNIPSKVPSAQPSLNPSYRPSMKPSDIPSSSPSMVPSGSPSLSPSFVPSVSMEPSHIPSLLPSYDPDKKSNVAGLVVDILGQSGKMNLRNNNRTVQITMDALREVDSDGNVVGNTGKTKHSIQSFANQQFTFGIRDYYTTLFIFNSTTNQTVPEAANGLRIDFSSILDTGSKLKVQALLVSEGGIAGDAQGNWTVSPGDFKWNIWFEDWVWFSSAAYVELDIEIKGANGAPTQSNGNLTYELGNETQLDIRSDYELSNGTAVSMPDGYPLMTTQGSKTIFTFKFGRHGDLGMKYDPLVSFDTNSDSNSTEVPSENSTAAPSISVRSLFKMGLSVSCPFSESQLQGLMNSLQTSITELISISNTSNTVTVTSASSIECPDEFPQFLRYLAIQALDFIVETLSEANDTSAIPLSTDEVIELIKADISSNSSVILNSVSLNITQQVQVTYVEEIVVDEETNPTIAPSASTSAGNSVKPFLLPMMLASFLLYVM